MTTTHDALIAEISRILSPAINCDAPYAKFMIAEIAKLLESDIIRTHQAPSPQPVDELAEDAPIEAVKLEYPLETLMDWYNHPNAVTEQRFQYFDAVCRHVLYLEQALSTHTPTIGSDNTQTVYNLLNEMKLLHSKIDAAMRCEDLGDIEA